MTELISWAFGKFGDSVLSAGKDFQNWRKQQQQELRFDFVLEAIGQRDCLSPSIPESGTVSLHTIELRIRQLQLDEPERARKCGMPTIDNPTREQDIKNTLGEMVRAKRLRRSRFEDRWYL